MSATSPSAIKGVDERLANAPQLGQRRSPPAIGLPQV
jgi:hypothetical protein